MDRYTKILKTLVNPSISGLSYAIMEHGRTVAIGALGESFPKTTDLYNVGSVSKVYVSAAIMKLCEMGLLELDGYVCAYLPKFKMADERYKKITVRQLLCHTSGLPGTCIKSAFNSRAVADYKAVMYEYLENAKLKAEPGEYAVYCNDGFTVAEMIVEQISGMNYGEFLKKYTTGPIGAHSTACSNDDVAQSRIMSFKNKSPEYLAVSGAGGIQSNMEDVCKFGGVFLGWYKGILSEKSIEEMGKCQGGSFIENDSLSFQYGLGWDYVDLKMRNFKLSGVLEKGGTTVHFNSSLLVFKELDMVVSLSATLDHGANVLEAAMTLAALYIFDSKGINIFTDREPVPAEIQDFKGVYHSNAMTFNVEINQMGADVFIEEEEKRLPFFADMLYKDGVFNGKKGEKLSFSLNGKDSYMLINKAPTDFTASIGQKFGEICDVPSEWENRMGKKYIVTGGSPYDLFLGDNITGCQIIKTSDGMPALMVLGNCDKGAHMTVAFKPISDDDSCDIIKISAHGGRDLMLPRAYKKDGAEYIFVNSYHMIDVDALPLFEGSIGENKEYKVNKLKYLPSFNKYNRLLILDSQLSTVYDSVTGGEFKGIDEGYILAL